MATNTNMTAQEFADGRMFQYLSKPKDLRNYTLMRGAPDFAKVEMWNEYESGYGYLVIVQIPKFLEMLADKDSDHYGLLIENYKRVLEYEFKGLDGIENITSELGEINTGISQLQFINKVNMQNSTTFSMRYTEKAGALITKVHELFLTGIKDGRTQIKRYHGLLDSGDIEEAGYENETFSFMYFVTDNTFRKVEKAYYIVAAQPTSAATGDLYNYTKGEIEFKEISVEFVGFPLTSNEIDAKAQAMLDWLNDASNPNKYTAISNNFKYSGVSDINEKI